MSNEMISKLALSKELGVTLATLNNWIKLGVITYPIDISALELFKKKLNLGEIKKLRARANKIKSCKKFLPKELIDDVNKKIIIQLISLRELFNSEESYIMSIAKKIVYEIFNLKNSAIDKIFLKYENINIDVFKDIDFKQIEYQKNILGLLYQSTISESKKVKLGSYYTPNKIIKETIAQLTPSDTFFDPSCGTGNFLIEVAQIIKDPKKIVGCELDEVAADIAKINLAIEFKNIDFEPTIYTKNFLEIDENIKYSFIATNPPWGACVNQSKYNNYFGADYGESYSFFILKAARVLSKDGIISFLLPESILNVKRHNNIRNFICNNFNIISLKNYDRVFEKVLSKVILLTIKKSDKIDNSRHIFKYRNGTTCFIEKYSENVKKILSKPHFYLNDENITFGLGIVTGDNLNHINKIQSENSEIILLPENFSLCKLNFEKKFYIKYNKNNFQQSLPRENYIKQKICYKFIGTFSVVFDEVGYLTLNSVNFFTLSSDKISMKGLTVLLSSNFYKKLFYDLFFSIKILNWHILNLPILEITKDENIFLEKLFQLEISNEEKQKMIDEFVDSKLV